MRWKVIYAVAIIYALILVYGVAHALITDRAEPCTEFVEDVGTVTVECPTEEGDFFRESFP